MSEHAQTSSRILGRSLLWHGHCHELPRAVDWFQSEMNSSHSMWNRAIVVLTLLASGVLSFAARIVLLIWLAWRVLKRI